MIMQMGHYMLQHNYSFSVLSLVKVCRHSCYVHPFFDILTFSPDTISFPLLEGRSDKAKALYEASSAEGKATLRLGEYEYVTRKITTMKHVEGLQKQRL